MKSQEITELVEKKYFSCNNPNHRHQTREVAEYCIFKYEHSQRTKKSINHWDKNKKIELWNRYKAGETQKKLAEEFNVSCARINQICNQGKRWAYKLSYQL